MHSILMGVVRLYELLRSSKVRGSCEWLPRDRLGPVRMEPRVPISALVRRKAVHRSQRGVWQVRREFWGDGRIPLHNRPYLGHQASLTIGKGHRHAPGRMISHSMGSLVRRKGLLHTMRLLRVICMLLG